MGPRTALWKLSQGIAIRHMQNLRSKHGHAALAPAYLEARELLNAENHQHMKEQVASFMLTREDMNAEQVIAHRFFTPLSPLAAHCHTVLKVLNTLDPTRAEHQQIQAEHRTIHEGVIARIPSGR